MYEYSSVIIDVFILKQLLLKLKKCFSRQFNHLAFLNKNNLRSRILRGDGPKNVGPGRKFPYRNPPYNRLWPPLRSGENQHRTLVMHNSCILIIYHKLITLFAPIRLVSFQQLLYAHNSNPHVCVMPLENIIT